MRITHSHFSPIGAALTLVLGCAAQVPSEAPAPAQSEQPKNTTDQPPATSPAEPEIPPASGNPASSMRRAAPDGPKYNEAGELICGGFAGDTCSATEYCAYQAGQYCGAADASAVCKARPQACTAQVEPVCGCDSKAYSSACQAALAGVGVLNQGPCTPNE